MTLAFDLLDVPADVRQHVTRIMLLCAAAAQGHDIASLAGEHVRIEALSTFYSLIAPYRDKDPSAGLFGFRALDAALFQQALRQVTQKAPLSARSWVRPGGSSERRATRHTTRRHRHLRASEGSTLRSRV